MTDALRAHRRALHLIPELGYDLPDTQAYILKALSDTRAEITPLAPSGALAYFDFGARETFAFRADMDALPINEQTGALYASRHAGIMHACGHDGHMATLLALAEALNARTCAPGRNALLIFQPAEESGNGAAIVIESGALEKYGVSEIYATHVDPALEYGALSTKPGAFMAMSTEVLVNVRGKSAHVARADEGADALEAGAEWLLRARSAIDSEFERTPRLFRFGRFTSGQANNIISDFAQMHGSLRAFDSDIHARMAARIREIALDTALKYGVKIDVQLSSGYPPLINNQGCYERFRRAVSDTAYTECRHPHMTTEDFACYTKRVPGLMFNTGLGVACELHTPAFDFDEGALNSALNAFLKLLDS